MEKHEHFSVSMCVYEKDNPRYFDEAIFSVVNQTVLPNEIVLVVDGPIPEVMEQVIEKYRKMLKKIDFRVIYLEKNMGHGEARRIGLENCSNELIALMDADDLSVECRFEKQLDFFSLNPHLSVVGGYIQEFVEHPASCVGMRVVPINDSEIKQYMKKRCPMNQVTVMFKRTDVAAVGGYIDWYCEEDYYLWIRLALAGYQFGNVGETLVNVRVGEEMYSRRGGKRYFCSEYKLQRFMLEKKVISRGRFLLNVSERLVLQLLIPNKLRGFLFQRFAREYGNNSLCMNGGTDD